MWIANRISNLYLKHLNDFNYCQFNMVALFIAMKLDLLL